MSGAVTNTPGFGAAKKYHCRIKNQFQIKHLTTNNWLCHHLSFRCFGIIGVIILSKVLLKIHPDVEMRKFRMNKINHEEPLIHKKLRVTDPQYFGIPLGEVISNIGYEIVVSRLKHSGEVSSVFHQN